MQFSNMNVFLFYIGLISCDNEPSSTVQIVPSPKEEVEDWLDGERTFEIYSGLREPHWIFEATDRLQKS